MSRQVMSNIDQPCQDCLAAYSAPAGIAVPIAAGGRCTTDLGYCICIAFRRPRSSPEFLSPSCLFEEPTLVFCPWWELEEKN
jgi:hypothetical protein